MTTSNKEFIREFIEEYRANLCLWRVKSPVYSNKFCKKAAYIKLMSVYDRHHHPDKANELLVRKKLQALRTVFKKELNKVEDSKKSGSGMADIYIPKLWYFDLLMCTRDHELHPPLPPLPLQVYSLLLKLLLKPQGLILLVFSKHNLQRASKQHLTIQTVMN